MAEIQTRPPDQALKGPKGGLASFNNRQTPSHGIARSTEKVIWRRRFMKIGLTYDLRSEYLAMGYGEEETAEFDRDDTVVAVEGALASLGHVTDRIGHALSLTRRLVAGDRWDLVFNIAEGLHGVGREAQVPAILDLYQIPYTFSDPLVMSLTLDKGMTKRVARDCGFPTPDFAVLDGAADLGQVAFDPPYFVKPLSEGTSKGIGADSIIRHKELLAPACLRLHDQFQQPVLVEQYLGGREFTIGLVGTGDAAEVLGTLEVFLLAGAEEGVYSYLNKERCEELVQYRLARAEEDKVVRQAEAIALGIYKALGCRDAGRLDVRCDDHGQPFFLEINPLAGIHPEHSDLPILCNHLQIPYVELIRRIIASACRRVKARPLGEVRQAR
jgi:D-alanine-D-alanine ligase